MNDTRHFYAYNTIEFMRERMKQNKTILTIDDYGAGSTITSSNKRKVNSIAYAALKPKKFGQLLFRIVNFYSAKSIVELGTSLGITTAYLAAGNVLGKVCTFEGAHEVAEIAEDNFYKLSLKNIKVIEGNFDNTLLPELSNLNEIDLAFVDGNHRKEPTLRYFEQLLTKTHEHSILIFDDIHWSNEMEEAWKMIKQHSSVTLTIDLFFIGIVFFRKEHKAPQHFTIRF